MDDPNNPSIPASNSFPTPESAVPEMSMPGPITQPTASQFGGQATTTTTSTPTSTTTSTTTQPTASQFGGQATPTPDLSPVLPAPEVEWPGSKPKSKLPQILGGIAAIILVVGVATAAYFVSNKISGRQAVAPTAPESEPLAAKKKEEEEVKKKWEKPAIDEKGRPRQSAENIPGYTCTAENCPGPEFKCINGNTCINVADPNKNVSNDEENCGGAAGNGGEVCGPGQTCEGGVCVGAITAPTATPTKIVIILPPIIAPTATPTDTPSNKCPEGKDCYSYGLCGTCNSAGYCENRRSCPTGGCAPVGGPCTTSMGPGVCIAGNPNMCRITSTAPSSIDLQNDKNNCGQIGFLCAGTCKDGRCSGGTKPLGGSCQIKADCDAGLNCINGSCTSGGGGTTGTTTTTTTKKTGGGGGENESANTSTSCNEQCPGSDGVLRSCTPPEADGSSNDSLCNSAGRAEVCGGNNYCCPAAGGTWTTDMTNCSTTTTVTAGACYDVVLFAKIDGVYSTTPMTVAQKTSLHIGDMIRIAITGSKADLKARFRVYINEVVEPTGNTASPEWRLGQTFSGANHKTTFYSDYEIKSAGNYKFEGQVTTEP